MNFIEYPHPDMGCSPGIVPPSEYIRALQLVLFGCFLQWFISFSATLCMQCSSGVRVMVTSSLSMDSCIAYPTDFLRCAWAWAAWTTLECRVWAPHRVVSLSARYCIFILMRSALSSIDISPSPPSSLGRWKSWGGRICGIAPAFITSFRWVMSHRFSVERGMVAI